MPVFAIPVAVKIAVSVASAALTAVSAIQQGQNAKKAAEYQATVQEQNAQRAQDIARINAQHRAIQDSATMASQRALLGGGGFEGNTGTPLLVQAATAGRAEQARLTVLNQGDAESIRLLSQAELNRLQGRNAAAEGLSKGGALLLSGVSKAFS